MSWHCHISGRWARSMRLAATVATAMVGLSAFAASANASSPIPNASANYSFNVLNDPADPTFNQLLGINEIGTIAGYFGSGEKGHPNKGYTLPNDGKGHHFRNENFPGSKQTQVTGLNNVGVTVGFWVNGKGANHGFYATHGKHFHTADYPNHSPAKPVVDQLLGVNDKGLAVGFYNDSKGNSHGYTYSISKHRYGKVKIAGATSVTAAAVNNWGDIAGFETNSAGNTRAFLQLSNGHVDRFSVPGATMTQAFGVNDGDLVVGAYQLGTGNTATSHGFIWSPGFGFATVDEPAGIGSTLINGVNDHGRIVGFYTDSAGNTDGFLGTPKG